MSIKTLNTHPSPSQNIANTGKADFLNRYPLISLINKG